MNQIQKVFGKPYAKPFDLPLEKPVQNPVCYCMGCSITGNCIYTKNPEIYIEDIHTLKRYKTFSEYLMDDEPNIKEEEIIPECCKKEMNDYEYIHHMTYNH